MLSAALLSLVAAAGAHPPAMVYGGTTLGNRPFALQVSADHRRLVRALVFVEPDCKGGGWVPWSGAIAFRGRRLGPSGWVAATARGTQAYGDRVARVKQTLTGQISGSRASGTLRIRITFPDRTTCDTGVLLWGARAAPGRVFAGLTADRRPVVLELSPDALRVEHLRIAWAAACGHDGSYWILGDDLLDFRLDAARRFRARFGSVSPGAGSEAAYRYSVSGRIGRRDASGTLAVTVTATDATGAVTDSCSLPRMTWRATS